MHRSFSAVLFDLDDTLIDWSQWRGSFDQLSRRQMDAIHNYLTTKGHVLPDQEAFVRDYRTVLIDAWDTAKKSWAGVRFADVLKDYFNSLALDTCQIDWDELLLALGYGPLPGVVPFADAIEVLEQLKQDGFRMGLITNSMFPMWMRDIELKAYDLLDYFDVRLTSGDAGYMKPHPAIYHQALDKLNVAAEQAVFVGDRPVNDIAGANKAGLISVLMAPPTLERDLEGVEPHFTIKSLSELLPILRALESEGYGQTRTE